MPHPANEDARAEQLEEAMFERISRRELHDVKTCQCPGCAVRRWDGEHLDWCSRCDGNHKTAACPHKEA